MVLRNRGNKCIGCGALIDYRAMKCGSCARKGKGNPMYGSHKPISEAHKKKIQIALLGKKNAYKGGSLHKARMRVGQQYRSRIVMEQLLGRVLKDDEVVHHLDGNTLDDDPLNLRLFDCDSRHRTHHGTLAKYDKKGLCAI